jgi:hypothetical protein
MFHFFLPEKVLRRPCLILILVKCDSALVIAFSCALWTCRSIGSCLIEKEIYDDGL